MPQAADQPLLNESAEGSGGGSSACAGCRVAVLEAQRAEGGWWHSRLRVLVCLWGSAFLWSTCWLGSYIVWLADGCVVFLPFVSDFGAAASPTYHWFEISMTLAALLWLPSWFDHFHATQHRAAARHQLERRGLGLSDVDSSLAGPSSTGDDPEAQQQLVHGSSAPRAASLVERIQPYVGVICSFGIIGVALDPEDVRIIVHGSSANAAFMGGVAFTWISTWLRRQRGQPWCVSLLGNIIATASFLMLGPSMTYACTQASNCDITDPMGWFGASMQLMQADHGRYCRGDDLPPAAAPAPPPASNGPPPPSDGGPSMHGVSGVNMAAFFEWTMLIAILINVLVNFHHDLKGWPRVPLFCDLSSSA
eukprot:COSAG06_NODE_8530_length_2137_cov_5.898921_2_plen_363_part_01